MGVVIRQSFKGTVLTYIGAALGFVTQFFVVTKFLSPEVIGLTKVFYEVAALFAGFALLGVTSAGMRFFPYFKDEKSGNHGFFFYYLCVPFIGTILISLIFLVLKEPVLLFFSSKSSSINEYFYLIVPLIFILTFWQVLENYSNMNMRIAFPKGVREVCLRIFMLSSYLLFAFEYIDLTGLILAVLMSYGMCLMLDLVYTGCTSSVSLKHDNSFLTPDLKSKYLKYTSFLILSAVSGNIMNQLDIFMLSSVKGLYSAGIYTIAFYMANIIDMPSRSISAISTPLAADALKNCDLKKANDLYKKVSIHQLMVSLILLILIWVNLDNIYAILPNGDKFEEGKYVVLFLGLSKIISTTLSFGGVLIQFSKYYYWTLFISIFLTVLTICTNLLFIPRMGVSGAALATLITTVVSFSYQQWLVQRKIHGNPFSVETVLLLLVAAVLLGLNHLIPSLTHISPWLDMVVRGIIIAAIAAIAVLKLKISPEINSIAERLSDKLKFS